MDQVAEEINPDLFVKKCENYSGNSHHWEAPLRLFYWPEADKENSETIAPADVCPSFLPVEGKGILLAQAATRA